MPKRPSNESSSVQSRSRLLVRSASAPRWQWLNFPLSLYCVTKNNKEIGSDPGRHFRKFSPFQCRRRTQGATSLGSFTVAVCKTPFRKCTFHALEVHAAFLSHILAYPPSPHRPVTPNQIIAKGWHISRRPPHPQALPTPEGFAPADSQDWI